MNELYYKNPGKKTRVLNFFRKAFKNIFFEKLLTAVRKPSFLSRLIPPHYLYKKGSWRKYKRKGIKLKLDISHAVDHHTYFNYPDKGFDNFLSLIKENAIVLDIGANIGTTTLRLAQKATRGKVVSYEPSKNTFGKLPANVGMNDFDNIIVQYLMIHVTAIIIQCIMK